MLLGSLGHEVHRATVDWGVIPATFVPRFLRGARDEAAGLPRPERFEARTRTIVRMGGWISDRALARARREGDRAEARLNRVFDDVDVLLTPVAPYPAEPVGKWAAAGAVATMNRSAWARRLHRPVEHRRQARRGRPRGVARRRPAPLGEVVGRRGDEATVLSVAAQLESARPWAARRPPVH